MSDQSDAAQSEHASLAAERPVTLQVGERRFFTTVKTLTQESGFFAALLSGRWDNVRAADGSYFIDADPDLFDHILRYLRCHVFPVFYNNAKGHDHALYNILMHEARYFGIASLENWLENHRYLRHIKIRHFVEEVEGMNFYEVADVDEQIEYHPSWQSRKVYICPRGISDHRGKPSVLVGASAHFKRREIITEKQSKAASERRRCGRPSRPTTSSSASSSIMPISTDLVLPHNILTIFNAFHLHGQEASFAFGTNTMPYHGKRSQIYVVNFPDETTWAMHVPVHAIREGAEAISSSVEHEVTMLQVLRFRGFVWAFPLVGYDPTFDNEIQFPYIITSWVSGVQLIWNDNEPAARVDRDKILVQLAHVIVDLAGASHAQGNISSLGYLTDAIDRKIDGVLKEKPPSVDLRSCFHQRALVSEVFKRQEEQPTTFISHEDLEPSHIFIDNAYNIRGIIGWGSGRILPAQVGITLPRFLSTELWSPGSIMPPFPTSARDRQFLLQMLFNLAYGTHRVRQFYSPYLLHHIYTTLANPNVDWIRLLFESVFNTESHNWMVERSWLEGAIKPSSSDWTNPFKSPTAEDLLKQVDLYEAGRSSRPR
ncbi:hypothetical protein B7494_g6087 [Chlorociboria aeruginascens]|nr:hypothetical protein B7494_g6087 [Chlorociboria aeruginascens]